MDYKEIKEPFAVNGDREGIDYTPTSPEVSWLGGYSYLYGLKPDETDLNPYIEREKFNEIMFLMSSKMLDIEKYAQGVNQDLDDTKQDLDNTKNTLGDDYVTRGTAQTISGLKTFDTALPRSAKNPTHQDELVRMGYLSSGAAGMLLTGEWQNNYLQKLNPANTWVTNTSNKPIGVLINLPTCFKCSSFRNLTIRLRNGTLRDICFAGYSDDGSYTGTAFFILNPKCSWKTQGGAYYSEFK